ncbi:hypothetical protein [Marinobacterium aestuariivivens]|uniref:Uncharacterized protein n=1 Tax=Marinobacterium aestuariivivens TaxID=1698799 RepID=A0ABW2A514_9GAMM
MPNSSASNRLIDPIVQVARHNRQEIDTLLANAGLARDALPPSAPRLESATLEKLLEQLARSTGNGRIALRVADATPPGPWGPSAS